MKLIDLAAKTFLSGLWTLLLLYFITWVWVARSGPGYVRIGTGDNGMLTLWIK